MTRRFGPLIVLVLCAYGIVIARLGQVQLVEHETWASEARNLSRGSTFVPHVRGRILDRKGREFVRDEQVYELEFIWRSFRRGHPLGQLCVARSLLELRPVALVESWRDLERWAEALTNLTPEQVDDYGRGKALIIGAGTALLEIPEAVDARLEQRYYRGGHLHFYLKALLEVDRFEARTLSDLKGQLAWERPYRQVIAEIRDQSLPQFDDAFFERISRTRTDVARLA
ncbi:MAG: cell division protein FtsI/penicillin-binding protein 2, partial [Planctomycetota bacterium]